MPTRKKGSKDLSSKKAAGKSPLFPPIGEKQMREKLKELTSPGISDSLDRLGITRTRGQGYALSPDQQFEAKRAFIEGVLTRSKTDETGKSENSLTDQLFYLDNGNLGIP